MQYGRLPSAVCVSERSHPKCKADCHALALQSSRMDAKAIRRAAAVTLCWAICQRLPLGRERRAWLEWLAGLAAHGLAPPMPKAYGPTAL
jgi:hypothetical protein